MTRRGHNEGSIYKRADGRWVSSISVEGGKRKDLYGKTRQEVARKLTRALSDHSKGLPVDLEGRQSFEQFAANWLEAIRPTVRPKTWLTYRMLVRLHLMPSLGHIRLAKLSPEHVQRLYVHKLTERLSPTTVRHIHMVLHRALRAALKLGLVARNVSELVEVPRMAEHKLRVLTQGEARRLLDAARGDRLEALYVVALATGLRQGEILALTWEEVDLDRCILNVRATLQRLEGHWHVGEPKSKRSRRQIALSVPVVDALRQHQVRQAKERTALGKTWFDGNLVFCTEVGTPIDKSHLVPRSFVPLLTRAGLPRVRFHDLRHTAATLLLGQGVNPKIVSEMLGHSTVNITLDIYSHVLPDMQEDAAAAMARALGMQVSD